MQNLAYVLCCSVLILIKLHGQDHRTIDSLQNLLEDPSIDAYAEANVYTQLSKLLIAHYPDSSYNYVTKALALAVELEDNYLICKTYTNSSMMDINHARYELALQKLNIADSLTFIIDTTKHDPIDIQRGRKVILQNRSITYQFLNDIESSIRDNLESLKISEALNDSFGISLQYYNLAYAHNSLDNRVRTKKYLDQALQIARKINYPFVISGSLIFKCSLLSEEDKLDSIKIYALEALEIAEKNNNFQNRMEASRLLGIAYIEEDSLLLANEILEEVLENSRAAKSSFYEAGTLISLGMANNRLGKYAASKNYFDQFFKINLELNNTHLEKQALYEYADLEQTSGKYKHANELLKKYYTLQDSIFTEENRRITSDLDAKYEAAQKDIELANQQATIDKQTYERNLFICSGILSLLLAGFFWNRKNTSEKIYTQQKQIDTQKITQLEKEKKILTMSSMIQGQEAERKRIAQDLHDGLGGLLASVKTKFGIIQNQIKELESLDVYNEANTMLDNACTEVRKIAHNMMPDALSKLGLVEAVNDIALHYGEMKVNVINLGMLELNETQKVMLYRVIQEFLNNTRKHAVASEVIIQFYTEGDQQMIYLEDNGSGFDKFAIEVNNGMGLKSMESRINYINGTMELNSAIGVGTTMTISIPGQT